MTIENIIDYVGNLNGTHDGRIVSIQCEDRAMHHYAPPGVDLDAPIKWLRRDAEYYLRKKYGHSTDDLHF